MSLHDSVVSTLSDWRAPNPEQDALREAVQAFVLGRPDACQRGCVPGHVTASLLVLDHTGSNVLLTLHPRLQRWVQLGGHCELDDADIASAALREGIEESGIADLTLDTELVAVHVHSITCSLGLPTRHLDLQFLGHAPADAELSRSDESLDLQWWPLDAPPENSDYALSRLISLARDRLGFRAT